MKIKGKNFINGKWVEGSLGALDMINPSYDKKIGEIARSGHEDVEHAVRSAQTAFEGPWAETDAAERGKMLAKAAEILYRNTEELAELEAADTGKPITQARADAELSARYFEFYAGAADKLHGETIPFRNGYTVYTHRVPLGVTGHIIPWNYPLQMTGRTLGPSLAAGNTTVFKPAEDACLSVVRLFELIEGAGFPAGVLNLVTGKGEEAGDALARHPGIDHMAFTGSPRVGIEVMKHSAEHIRPTLLELGGKSPQVLFEDADMEAAMPVIVNAIIQNAGQTCSAGSRLVVQDTVHDAVVDELANRFRNLKVAPAESDPDVGPIINKKQLKRVEEFVENAKQEGARVMAQSALPKENGYYYPPTLLSHVSNDSSIAQNEVFGPVLTVIPFKDEREAIEIANNVEYGLVAAVWTRNFGRAHRVANAIKAGQVYVNGYGAGGGVELPFGGMKKSGFGREKGFEALFDVTAVKTTILNHG
ncbi:aldehyde dehydrogenase family protein [Rhodohalobacter mucosus]|uniref:Aldehyde dehydrogenase n=1 Tax=Rhodohalobacter mucosus TaxID=2079485 RepID=A0A316TVN3_9BACT|nr:aldehyde dehydrogenase family protein [Rhodohalobacter mucosus]PWN07891.1 aldehyde dehydrogenase [Rhodohalobacter mucosus]